jgi:phosphoesterase RecJ-like protein
MDIIQRFIDAISDAKNIVLSTHIFPDADGIGSEISLCAALNKLGKNAKCIMEEPLLDRYKYLDPDDHVIGLDHKDEFFPEKPDLIIVVDTNTLLRTGSEFAKYAQESNCPVFFIDHHPCSEKLQDNHCIDTTAAATGQLVGNIIEKLGVEFDKKIALPLYTAILIDTSSFRYPTVTADTHRMIAKFLDTGIEAPIAYNGIYGTKKIQHMHLLGEVLATTDSNKTEDVSWIVLHKDVLEEYDTDIEDTHAFINHLLVLDNMKVACMFRDDGDSVKISLRSSGDYDVGVVAIGLGGGGHSHSAATVIYKNGRDLEQIIEETISKIEEIIHD